jgi:hypothetical protein
MASDVKAIRVTGTGLVNIGPARIRAIHLASGSDVARLTITNGSGGATVFDGDFKASDTTYIGIPDQGIRCEQGIVVSTFTNLTSITILYN